MNKTGNSGGTKYYWIIIMVIIMVTFSVVLLLKKNRDDVIKPQVTYAISDAESLTEFSVPDTMVLVSMESDNEYEIAIEKNIRFRDNIPSGRYNVYFNYKDGLQIMYGSITIQADGLKDDEQKYDYIIGASRLNQLCGCAVIAYFRNEDGSIPKSIEAHVSGDGFDEYSFCAYGSEGCYIIDLWTIYNYNQDITISIEGYKDINLSLDFSRKRTHIEKLILYKE